MIIKEHRSLDRLYHGTNIANAVSILRHGLDPSKSVYAQEEEEDDYDGFGAPYHFVYLSEDPRIARDFAPGGQSNTDPDAHNSALFEITLPPELQQQLVLDRGEFIRAPFVIPPRFIKQIA